MMLMLAAFVGMQDAEVRYREALYQEVDRGDLEKAIELYRKVEADGSAAESARARSAFRLAWCFEKQGKKVDAERGYRDVMARYAGQNEIAAKARERLDRLVSGNGAPLSPDDRISELILQLGLIGDPAQDHALRTLVLLGDAAVPALRRALTHKDVYLSASAACALVQLEQDDGTYAPIVRTLTLWGGLSNANRYLDLLRKLLHRQEGYRKDFIESFLKKDDWEGLGGYLEVLKEFQTAEVRARVRDLLCSAPIDDVDDLADFLAVREEEELLTLLERLSKGSERWERALHLLRDSDVKVVDEARYGRLIAQIFSEMVPYGDPVWEDITRPVEEIVVLEAGAQVWLQMADGDTREPILDMISKPHPRHVRLACTLYESKLKEPVRLSILEGLRYSAPKVADPEARSLLEKTLWKAYDEAIAKEERVDEGETYSVSNGRREAARGLWELIPDSHPRWGDVAESLLEQDREFMLKRTVKVLPLLHRLVREGTTRQRCIALPWLLESSDKDRYESFAVLALDPKAPKALRLKSLETFKPETEQAAENLVPLLQEKDPDIRLAAVHALSFWGGPEVDGLLAPLVEDPIPSIEREVVIYFCNYNRESGFKPLVAALKSKNQDLRRMVTKTLAQTEAVEVVPHLIRMLEDEDPEVRQEARSGLEAIKKHHEEVGQWKRWYEGVKPK